MRKFTKFITWPTVSGILLALVILQQFPELTRKSTTPTPHITQVNYDNGITPVSYNDGGNSSTADSSAHKATQQSGPVSYNPAVRKAAPAVVNIYTTKIIREHRHPILDDPFFRDFFGYDQMPNQQRMQSSLGSGVIMSPEGYVVTNNHVIKGADEIIVALQDGRDTKARVIGTDPDTDLAVLKIDLKNLPSITLARSREAGIGDVVLAIGNPFGVGQTVTMGIISATGRNKLRLSTYEDFIQTDAAINPGNSGGALINAYGDLIGINTAIFSKSGGSQGIGFAIPSEIARDVMLSIIKHGKVVRGWLGIEAQSLTPELADAFGLSHKEGILITGVYRNGPAYQAGLQRGDIITEINSMSAKAGRKVMQQVALMQPGEQIVIKAFRNGQKLVVNSVIGQRPNFAARRQRQK